METSILLHGYQPPIQPANVVDRILREAYVPVLSGLLRARRGGTLTINISPELVERLLSVGEAGQSTLRLLRESVRRGKTELSGSSYCHWILPLVPSREAEKQIQLGQRVLKEHFGETAATTTLFPPELAISSPLVEVARQMGFRALPVDESGIPVNLRACDTCRLDESTPPGESRGSVTLGVRRRYLSRLMTAVEKVEGKAIQSPRQFVDAARHELGTLEERCIILADDWEHFGHHIANRHDFLLTLVESPEANVRSVGEALAKSPPTATCEVISSSWGTRAAEIQQQLPFARWNDPNNEIHGLQWAAARLLIRAHSKLQMGDAESENLLRRIGKALHSCQFWWASCRPEWSERMVQAGAALMSAAGDACRSAGLLESPEATELDQCCARIGSAAQRWTETGEYQARVQKFRRETREPLIGFHE